AQRIGEGEYDVKINERQNFGGAVEYPLFFFHALAQRAMPVSARIVQGNGVSAGIACFNSSTEVFGPAELDGTHDFFFIEGHVRMKGAICLTVVSKNSIKRWTIHR
ncbi:MAG TPA: hypothetical protein VLS45_07345, partial [Methylomicrobium sp.]|nr:hypothetical protein [Methylomicrobium sp.]